MAIDWRDAMLVLVNLPLAPVGGALAVLAGGGIVLGVQGMGSGRRAVRASRHDGRGCTVVVASMAVSPADRPRRGSAARR